jgi:hypothetical protein
MTRNELLNLIGIAYGLTNDDCWRNCELDGIINILSGGAVTPEITMNGKLRQILALTV